LVAERVRWLTGEKQARRSIEGNAALLFRHFVEDQKMSRPDAAEKILASELRFTSNRQELARINMSRPEVTGRKLPGDKDSVWVFWPEMVASGRRYGTPSRRRIPPAPRQVGPNSIAWLRSELEENDRNLPRRFPK